MSKQIKFGHTAITWDNSELEQAIAEIAKHGYWGTETFGWVLEEWDAQGRDLYEVFQNYKLELTSLYCHIDLVNPELREEELSQVMNWISLYEKFNSPIVVVGSKGIDRKTFGIDVALPNMVTTLNELAERLAARGKLCCFHPHTGTAVENEHEIRRLMDAVNTEVVKFAPDLGQIAKGGSDPLVIIRDYHDIIRMVHLKDYIGGPIEMNDQGQEIDKTGFLGYTPLGMGSVDIRGILDYLETIAYDGYASVELDGNQWSATRKGNPMMNQAEAVKISKCFLEEAGYQFKNE